MCLRWGQTQVWPAPSKACRKVSPVKWSWALPAQATEEDIRGTPLCPQVDPPRFLPTVTVAKAITPVWSIMRQPSFPAVLCTGTAASMIWLLSKCFLGRSANSAPEALSIYLGRSGQGELSARLQKQQFESGAGALATFSAHTCVCLLFISRSSRLPLTTIISPTTKRKSHWLIHTKVYRTIDVYPSNKEVRFSW